MEIKVPKLRFPEFTKGWNSVKLKNISKISKGKGISKSDISEGGKFKCIRYGELYTRYGEVIDEVFSSTDADERTLLFSEANDIIIPASGETAIDIATASCVLDSGIALGGDINIIKTKENGVFLAYYLNNKLKYDIAKLSQGSSVIHIYGNHLGTLRLNIPLETEQQKIANYLTTIDRKIELLEEKKEHLELYKKAMMQQLCSQQIRFKDDDGNEFPEWEEKRLGQILTIGSGRDYKHLDLGEIPVYGSGGIMTYVNEYLFEGESVCIGRKGTINRPLYLNYKFWTVDTLFYTKDFKECFIKFVYYVFCSINWMKYNEASGVPSLSKSTIEKITVSLPSLPEQQKIADFLTTIDTSIENINEQINQTQSFKKAMLQQLFV